MVDKLSNTLMGEKNLHYRAEAARHCVPPIVIPSEGQNVNCAVFQPRTHKQNVRQMQYGNAIFLKKGKWSLFLKRSVNILNDKGSLWKCPRLKENKGMRQLDASLTLDLLRNKKGVWTML